MTPCPHTRLPEALESGANTCALSQRPGCSHWELRGWRVCSSLGRGVWAWGLLSGPSWVLSALGRIRGRRRNLHIKRPCQALPGTRAQAARHLLGWAGPPLLPSFRVEFPWSAALPALAWCQGLRSTLWGGWCGQKHLALLTTFLEGGRAPGDQRISVGKEALGSWL